MRREEVIASWLVERIAQLLEIEANSVPWDASLADSGLSSLQAVEVADDLQRWTGLTLPPTLVFDYPTIERLSEYIADKLERRSSAPLSPLTRNGGV